MNRAGRTRSGMVACGAALLSLATQASPADLPANLAELSLEDLMSLTVTSVAKKEEQQFDAAAAISVLSNDDLARAGASGIPAALRAMPGLQAAAVNASQWAISARGFDNLYANKLLVLVDGRAVYMPQFAGVFWDLQQAMLDDVDRIEAIRGPGGTLWGANAVNGVINVVSRNARDTQGTLLYGGSGSVDPALAGARHGGAIGDRTWYRTFASYRKVDDFPLANGSDAGDAWSGGLAGFRLDGAPRDGVQWTWQGDATCADLHGGAGDASNVNTLGRWSQRSADGSHVELQAWYDRTHRDDPMRARSTTTTADLALQHDLALAAGDDLVWGLGYRHIDISGEPTNPRVSFRDPEATLQLYSAFVQNDLRLLRDHLTLTAGIKLEHNDFTGMELQPSVRAIFAPTQQQRVWVAVSRAVRTPDVIEGRESVAIVRGPPFTGPDGKPYAPTLVGNPDLESEVLMAYELGYRMRLSRRVSLDLASFYNDYRKLIGFGGVTRLVPGTPVGTAEMPWMNNVEGETHGGELVLAARPAPSLRLMASYALLLADLHGGVAASTFENGSPRQQASLGSSWDFTSRASVGAMLRYVSPIEAVPSYVTADVRLACRPRPWLELSLVGENLLDDRHAEQAPALLTVTSEVPRSVVGRIGVRF